MKEELEADKEVMEPVEAAATGLEIADSGVDVATPEAMVAEGANNE